MSNNAIERRSWLRQRIVEKLLGWFEKNIPIYPEMMSVARTINDRHNATERLGRVMHAAIRVASPNELQMVRRLFAVLGNHPVNYYDLREKVSVQSTAFRPTDKTEIDLNGFRIFVSMLDIECIDEAHRPFVQSIIDRRNVFSSELISIIEEAEQQGEVPENLTERFVAECVTLFTRPKEALISLEEYEKLRSINKVAAQVLVSNALAFNHLTPSVASVPEAHEEMVRRGIKTIPVYQGPVGKNFVLRQTSCLADPVILRFPNGDGTFEEAPYQETFVEFEERLQALTPKGRILFESMFSNGKKCLMLEEGEPGYAEDYYETMGKALSAFPENHLDLWKHGMAYFTFKATEAGGKANPRDLADMELNELIEDGFIALVPQIYEDFFGPAAANIFNSNIGLEGVSNMVATGVDDKAKFEEMLGAEVIDMYVYYQNLQSQSLEEVCEELGIQQFSVVA